MIIFQIAIIFVGYCIVGCIFNGFLNEEWMGFSISLMLFWPLAAGMMILYFIIDISVKIGKWIRKKLREDK